MAGVLSAIIAAIEAELATLGFGATDEVFDFDSIPASVMDKAYRILARPVANTYLMDGLGNPTDAIEIYIAYKTRRNPRAAWKTALDDRETIERHIINCAALLALSSDPIVSLSQEGEFQKYLSSYLVAHLVFTCDYLKDISAP